METGTYPRPAFPVAWVLGAGISGEAAALLLAHRGWAVTVLDGAPADKLADAATRLRPAGIVLVPETGILPPGAPGVAVVSPGLPSGAPLRVAAAQRGISLISELELGARHLRCPMVAVTGSKGKSSLVKVIADTLRLAGRKALPGGNYGTALSALADTESGLDWAVVECSSFQLEDVVDFRPRLAVFLNLSPDHLDRHGTMDAYRDIKLRLFERQDGDDVALLPSTQADGGIKATFAAKYRRPFETFGMEANAVWQYAPGAILRRTGTPVRIDLRGSPFDNEVLGPAAAAGVAVLWHAGVAPEAISEGFRTYVPLDHRMQPVATVNGVRYVNDSKATSLTALRAAVRMVSGPVRLIAGGRLKEEMTLTAKELLTAGVEKAYLIGECAGEMAAVWSPELAVEVCGTLGVAVEHAARDAGPGDTVLLSPGTASFDQFRNFQERGTVFANLAHRLEAVASGRTEETSK